ncbi:Retrovirus-related Pol polyprotein from transposon RE1 [Vitis vinifera]|uniref:Retrovirus-related Pol polyprotein from transposon RE1 n=1 Tax=Vitis vinifera TaxID=29760 RepID=A0A438FEX2_VITVI|nr:Retrovirus-related Pol polyprotein from transposon RE1 [Vitis vinifera]
MNTIRTLLSLAAHYNWQLLQYDVKNAFLHGDLDEEIYMNIPLGFKGNTGNKVCKLKKTFYGLKQSPRAWFGRFAKVMKESGYKQSQGKIGCKPVSTPMDPNHKLGEAKKEPVVDKRMYQRLVGRLIYLAHTLSDIAYSVSLINQFMHDPRESHLQATYRVLHYLKGNPGKGILFKKNNTLTLEAYTDANYVVDGPMKLYCDNKSAINIVHNPIQHDRTKHIEIDRHFIKEKLEEGVVCMFYVPSEHQLADILTKRFNSSMFHDFIFKLGMEDIYSSA